MAILSVSTTATIFCSKSHPQKLNSTKQYLPKQLKSPQLQPLHRKIEAHVEIAIDSLAKAGLAALLSTSLFFCVDPAFAFRGGGPYGIEVTRGQDLTGKDFSGKSLIKQDFKTSILRQVNFKGAKLLGASFFDADLTGADLSDADLRGADFSLANVTKANLTNANLEGASVTGNTSFKGTVITGADFTDVQLREDQRELLCKTADGVNPTTGNPTRETLLCK
ncbi:thylakoid lumenal 15 kDa protein 1, chloroplastic-like [Papaver somniferum]|uniref:thylakoid lumenal 15 kDa protein 1, chloroplastic-like n=1 Tax=Papaver somniferum TaxID=3469 RepID=UPI000E6F614F|nr:thylakoid lumenal 15 kDa protein 1, chloroplastic-like [Papaver somniferum]